MHFTYEITADQYVASQLLYHKLHGGRRRVGRAAMWIVSGLFFVVVALSERASDWAAILLAVTGIWWIYGGMRSLFPARYFSRAYRRSELAGKVYKADVDENGFEIRGDFCEWRVSWPGVGRKGENDKVFIFTSEGTIFIFGKKYLNSGQEEELRRVSGLSAS